MTDLSRYRNIDLCARGRGQDDTERILKLTGKIHKIGEVRDGAATTGQEQSAGSPFNPQRPPACGMTID